MNHLVHISHLFPTRVVLNMRINKDFSKQHTPVLPPDGGIAGRDVRSYFSYGTDA